MPCLLNHLDLAANEEKNFDYIRVPVLLHSVSSFSPAALSKTSSLVLQGLKCCIEQPGPLRNEIMTSPDFWVILKALATNGEAAPVVFDILESGVSGTPPAIMADNYVAAIALLNEFAALASVGAAAEQRGDKKQQRKGRPAKHEKPRLVLNYLNLPGRGMNTDTLRSENAAVARGVKAINIIYDMTSRIPQLMEQSHLESNEEGQFRCCSSRSLTYSFAIGMNIADPCLPRTAWSAYWLPVFEALTVQCTNPCREVRHLAFASLQRSLLSPELTSSDHKGWTAIFGEVLFPLIKRLLKPEVFSSDRDGMSETRVQAASLLCKVFLQYLVLLSEWDGMLELWLEIIEIMDRLMNSGQGDSLVSSLRTPSRLRLQTVGLTVACTVQEEAVPENLKNVLLFMSSSGCLVPPSQDPRQEKLWTETWKRIDRFLPDLRKELALDDTKSGATLTEESSVLVGEVEKPEPGKPEAEKPEPEHESS